MANTDVALSQLLVQKGLLTLESLENCLSIQKNHNAQGAHKTLEAILLERQLIGKGDLIRCKNCLVLGKEVAIDNYLFLDKLGEGGMGSVYRGVQLSLDRQVAIKLLDPELGKDKSFVDRFVQEARILAQLDHPHIVKGIDFGENSGIYYYIMEYLQGKSVNTIVESSGALSFKMALSIFLQMAKALEYAYQKGLVHRDIKPENMMLCRNGKTKLCDLGLAKWKASTMNITRKGAVIGTPYYSSPEQAKGEIEVDIRSDIYSLGASLFYMLSAKPPYDGDRPMVVYSRHITEPPPKITPLRPDLSPWFDKLIERTMAKELSQRIQTPTDLIAIVQRYVNSITSPRQTQQISTMVKQAEEQTSRSNNSTTAVRATRKISQAASDQASPSTTKTTRTATARMAEAPATATKGKTASRQKTAVIPQAKASVAVPRQLTPQQRKRRLVLSILLGLIGVFVVAMTILILLNS